MENERNWLSEIFSRLRDEYRQKEGWQIEYVDLRWGVSEKDGTDNRTMRVCLNELRRCQKLSPKPNFIFLLGQRYGWMPLPEVLPAQIGNEIEKISPLFSRLYRLDYNNLEFSRENLNGSPNAFPNNEDSINSGAWILQPFPEEASNPNWYEENVEPLHRIIFHEQGRENNAFLQRLDTSATQQEIWAGALASEDISAHVVGYIRRLDNFPNQTIREIYAPYENRDKLDKLISSVEGKIPKENILHREIPFDLYEKDQYRMEFIKEMERRIRYVIDSEIGRVKAESPLQINFELEAQANFLNQIVLNSAPRASVEDEILKFIFEIQDKYLLWLYGKPGCGKSTLLARALKMIVLRNQEIINSRRMFGPKTNSMLNIYGIKNPTPNPIYSYYICCGLTQETSTPIGVVRVLYTQMLKTFKSSSSTNSSKLNTKSGIADANDDSIPQLRIKILKNDNINCLIIIDGFNNFGEQDQDELLKILNLKLNRTFLTANCLGNNRFKFIISSDKPTTRYKDYDHYCQKHVGDMTQQEATLALELDLLAMKRSITPEQFNNSKNLIGNKKTAIYVKLLTNYLASLSSWNSLKSLPEDLSGLTKEYIDLIINQNNHDNYITWLILSLLSLNEGIEDWELIELLSHDEYVITQFRQTSKHEYNGEVAVPPIFWYRISYDLRNIIGVRPSPYGVVNAILRSDVRKAILDTADLSPSFNNNKISLKSHAVQLLFDYYITKWKQGNLHALYNLPWYCFSVGKPFELYDLLTNNFDYILGIIRFSKEHLDYCFSLLTSYRSSDGILYINHLGPDVPMRLNYLRTWILRNKDLGLENFKISAANTPNETFPYQMSYKYAQENKAWNNLLRNNLNDDNIIFTSVLRTHEIHSISQNAQRILFINKEHTDIKILDREKGVYYKWSPADSQEVTKEERIKFISSDANIDNIIIAFERTAAILKLTHKIETVFFLHTPTEINTAAISSKKGKVAIACGNIVDCFDLIEKKSYRIEINSGSKIQSVCFDSDGESLGILTTEMTIIHHQFIPGSKHSYYCELNRYIEIPEDPSKKPDQNVLKKRAKEEKFRANNRILAHKVGSSFMLIDAIPYQICIEDQKQIKLRKYSELRNEFTYGGVDSVVYRESDKELVCSTVDALVCFEGMSPKHWYNVPTLKFLTLNGRFGVTESDEIIDIRKAAFDSFQIKEDMPGPFAGSHEAGINSLSADKTGSWMVESIGVRHDDNCPLILSVNTNYNATAPVMKQKMLIPPYQDNLVLLTSASEIAPDGSLCACFSCRMDKVELILLDKNLNVFNHTISTPGIESAFLSQSPGWRKECVRRALWTEDSKYLVGVTWDYIDYIEGMAYVFNRKGEIIRRFTKGVTGGAGALIPQSLNASGRYLLSGNSYSRVLDLENNFVITELSNLSQPLWHPCGNIFLVVIDGVLVAYDTNTIEIDISNKATLKGIELIKGVKKLLAISPSGRFAYLLYETSVNNTLANNSNSGSGLEKLKPYLVKLDLATLKNKQWDIPVKNMVCTYDDNYVVVETEYCQIQLLDAESGEVIKKAYGKTVRGWMQNTQHALYAAISGQNPFMLAYPKELEVNKNSYATITRFWDYETKRLNQPKLVCPHCGKPFIPDKNLVNPLPIKVVLLDNFKQAFSPLNQNARNYLSCDCPNCGMHIYVNPFMA